VLRCLRGMIFGVSAGTVDGEIVGLKTDTAVGRSECIKACKSSRLVGGPTGGCQDGF
jgi:hypothetical protein